MRRVREMPPGQRVAEGIVSFPKFMFLPPLYTVGVSLTKFLRRGSLTPSGLQPKILLSCRAGKTPSVMQNHSHAYLPLT
jgi:hypothetical protein